MERSVIRENSGCTTDSGLTACIRATGNLSGNYVTLNNSALKPSLLPGQCADTQMLCGNVDDLTVADHGIDLLIELSGPMP